jgi:hypothetical protein
MFTTIMRHGGFHNANVHELSCERIEPARQDLCDWIEFQAEIELQE